GALAAGDHRAGMTHTLPLGCRHARDVGDDRLRHVLLDVRGRVLLRLAADLAHHHDALRLRIVLEELQAVVEIESLDGVAADADAGALPETGLRGLIDRL